MKYGIRLSVCCGVALFSGILLAGCGKRSTASPAQTGARKELEASLVEVHKSSRAAEEAVIAGANKGTFERMRTKFAATLSRAESAALKAPDQSENEEIAAHLRNYKIVLWGYEMYGTAWDFHDTYWNNCIRKGRQTDSCVDLYRKQGSELIAEAANAGIPIRPFVKDPMETVWTVASRLQSEADAQFLDAEPRR